MFVINSLSVCLMRCRFKCTYRKVAIRELFLNEWLKGGRENVSVFGGVHDPRESHKLGGSLF